MTRLLLDTDALLWTLGDPGKLSRPASNAIVDGSNDVFVSSASVWEVAIKRALGKLVAPTDLEAGIARQGFSALPMTFHHAEVAGALPRHRSLMGVRTPSGLSKPQNWCSGRESNPHATKDTGT